MWWSSVTIICVLCVNSFWCIRHRNNVCLTLVDYKTIDQNKNCSYNPDVGSTPRLIAKRYGYPLERHTATTKDGYILTLHRIPRSKNGKSTDKRQPILVQHGLAGSAAFWMLQGKKSLAFFLADNGFDVWLGNSRGTYYSPKHVSMTMNDPNYWNFGFHEMAIYDLPACIDYIANKTGEKGNLIYVGHSMGTTISYIYSIVEKQHAEDNLKAIVSLAPVAYMKNVMGTFKILAPGVDLFVGLLKSFGMNAVGQYHELQKNLISVTCSQYPLIIPCNLILILSSGLSVEEFQPELLPVFLSFYPSGVSLKTLQHFAQVVNSDGKFPRYDYGPTKNMKLYNSSIPPEYDVSQITLPVHLFVGSEDIVGNLKDAETLKKKISFEKTNFEPTIFVLPYAHHDFIIAKDPNPFYKNGGFEERSNGFISTFKTVVQQTSTMDAKTLQEKINLGKASIPARIYLFPYAHNDFFLARNLEPFHKTLLQVTQTKFN